METKDGLVQAPKGLLRPPTVNRYLSLWNLDQAHLTREPVAVRFQAEHSNDCWQFDMSPSDLKHIEKPAWIDPAKGVPTLMLFSALSMTAAVSITRNTDASMARTPNPRCASCSTPRHRPQPTLACAMHKPANPLPPRAPVRSDAANRDGDGGDQRSADGKQLTSLAHKGLGPGL